VKILKCTVINLNVQNAELLWKVGITPDGRIIHSTVPEFVLPAGTKKNVLMTAEVPFIPMKIVRCTVIMLIVIHVVKNWRGMDIPDGVIMFSAATLVPSADIQNPVLTPVDTPPTPIIPVHSTK